MICNENKFVDNMNEFFSSFGYLFEQYFNKADIKLNAEVVLQKVKERTIDSTKLMNFFDSLPEDNWTLKIFSEKGEEFNALFSISDDYIKEYCVSKVSKKELELVKWDLLKLYILESSKHANEYFDALKFNQNPKLSKAQHSLLNEMMITFKYLKVNSKTIYDKYEHRSFSERNIISLNKDRLPLELLWLKILNILFKVQNASDNKIKKLVKLLAKERISITYQKSLQPLYT